MHNEAIFILISKTHTSSAYLFTLEGCSARLRLFRATMSQNSIKSTEDDSQHTRREKRVPCRLNAVVEGIDKDGDFIYDEAECISISRKGVCVISDLKVELGDQVSLLVPAINSERRELMRVVWKREIDGEPHIGLGPVDEETHVMFGNEVTS